MWIKSPRQYLPKICFHTSTNFYLPFLPLLLHKIIFTIPVNTPFLYTSSTFHLLFFMHAAIPSFCSKSIFPTALDRCRFFSLFWSSFRGVTSFFISASIVWRFTAGSPILGETSLLLHLWLFFDLIIEGHFSRSLEPVSLPDIMLDLCFKTKEVIMYWLNFYSNFIIVKVISDFKLQIEYQRFTSDSDKDGKRMGAVWYRLVWRTWYTITWDFMNQNSKRFIQKSTITHQQHVLSRLK